MTDVSTPGGLLLTGTGLTVFGVATGIHPLLLIAGAAGGYWGLSYVPEMAVVRRFTTVLLSALVAAWGAPIIGGGLATLLNSLAQGAGMGPLNLGHPGFLGLVAVALGVLANPVLIPALVRQAKTRTSQPVEEGS